MELLTALCKQMRSMESLLPMTTTSSKNVVFHFTWGNFDMAEEIPSGAGTTHVAHGIVLQKIAENAPTYKDSFCLTEEPDKTIKPWSFLYKEKELPPCFVKGKPNPNDKCCCEASQIIGAGQGIRLCMDNCMTIWFRKSKCSWMSRMNNCDRKI